MAGALLTFQVASVGPGTWDRVTWTVWIWVMAIIGGSGNNRGVALGALSFAFLFDMIDQVQFVFQPYLPDFVDVNFFRYIPSSGLMILILASTPGCILPETSSSSL